MDKVTNIQLYAMFKECKGSSRFAKEPDFGHVVELVCTKMDFVSSEKPLPDVKTEFKHYKTYQQKSQSHFSVERGIEETPVLYRKNYVGKQKRPLSEVSDCQQRRRLSDFVVSTTSRASEENVSLTKLYAFGLKHKYLENKKVAHR